MSPKPCNMFCQTLYGLRRPGFGSVLICVLFLGVSGGEDINAQTERGTVLRADEYDVRAALVLNIAKLVHEREEDPRPDGYGICIAGREELMASFSRVLAGTQVRGKPVTLHAWSDTGHASCRLLYIGPAWRGRVDEVLASTRLHKRLTVSEFSPQAIGACMVVFRVVEGKVKLYISQSRIRSAGLDISSALLNVAEDLDRVQP